MRIGVGDEEHRCRSDPAREAGGFSAITPYQSPAP
jgi:hypothetical protein